MPEGKTTHRVVHICPGEIFSNSYHGSYKDTISRVRYFEAADCTYQQVIIEGDEPSQVLDQVSDAGPTNFLIEYSKSPSVLKAVRKQFPTSFIAVRSHNLEPLQHLDNLGWFSARGPLWMAYGMSRLLRNDLVAKKYASAIWSISDWENRVYWNRLPGPAEVTWLPYHCPDHLVCREALSHSSRKIVACMPTSQKNRKSWDLVCNFIAFAEGMRAQGFTDLDFVITGNLKDWELPDSSSVRFTGMIDDLSGFLGKTLSIAMLSRFGYGFKTTLGDAVANGASLLVHPRLYKRLPEDLKDGALAMDPSGPVNWEATNQWIRDKVVDTTLLQRHQELAAAFLDRLLVEGTGN